VDRRLRDELHRGERRQRAAIDGESDQTIVESVNPPVDLVVTAAPRLTVGGTLVVPRRVASPEGERDLEERFELREQLSSERNIAGDVFRAARYWDGVLYGDVVLKKPKSALRSNPEEYRRVHLELEREGLNLTRFRRHPGLLAPSGPSFVWDSELIIQTQYLPWSFGEYLRYFTDERWLTVALAGLAGQVLGAIDRLASTRDAEGPHGWAHVDLKGSHLRLDYREPEGSPGRWVIVIIDLDSVIPVGPIGFRGAKYNRACVDPEKFMALHDPGQLLTADPTETVYSLGVTFITAIAEGLGVLPERRGFRPLGLRQEGSRVVLGDEAELRAELERVRAVDRRNLAAVFLANRERRLALGLPADDPDELRELLAESATVPRPDPLPEPGYPPEWCVHPRLLVALAECLQPRATRLDARRLQAVFAYLQREA